LKYTEASSTIHNEPARKGRKKKQKNPGINPGQRHLKYTEAGSAIHNEPAGKRRKKKQKNPDINPGQPAGKERKKKQKNHGINPGQPAGKGREKKKAKRKTLVLTMGSPPERTDKKKSCPSVRRGPKTQNRDLDRRPDKRINIYDCIMMYIENLFFLGMGILVAQLLKLQCTRGLWAVNNKLIN
jgi:hypothetical protein